MTKKNTNIINSNVGKVITGPRYQYIQRYMHDDSLLYGFPDFGGSLPNDMTVNGTLNDIGKYLFKNTGKGPIASNYFF